ncbi:RNA methyltransferase [Phormidium tenue]|jgi:tRNA/rRNA methyltransferase|uniref:tRNA (cytidine/uridine-2'-O-)-methyltransferase TrmJ n=1 Tax=Phormidium tenue FACHB-1050 TaxID=2692857 RepID=A0ABR8CCQ6_9CYAN|nr:RNA methyltransferase [Phormidium tenue]MBD2317910.1 RNA methyltransferase [Phormidium tenue FACHB-1050]
MPNTTSNIRIVLVETAGARNLGSVARVMKNFGIAELWLVNPQCDRLGDEARHMAVHASEILENARIVDNLPDALVGCHRAIATAGRIDQGEMKVTDPQKGLSWLMQAETSAIVFGAEDRGLSNAEIQHCQQVIRIPVHPDYPSLNLAQSVGICCYQLQLLKANFRENPQCHENLTSQIAQDLIQSAPIDLATRADLEACYQQLEAVLLKIGYVYPHTAAHRLRKFRHIFDRANLSPSEVAMLRGILRQVNWATAHLDS